MYIMGDDEAFPDPPIPGVYPVLTGYESEASMITAIPFIPSEVLCVAINQNTMLVPSVSPHS